jgi:ATP-binding cassette subfamily C protein LapB
LGQIAGLLVRYQQTKMALKGLNEIMKLPVERPRDTVFLHRPVLHGSIEFCNVTFVYPGQKEVVLENVSFKINPGERVAFLGKIGSGKSTIEKLLMGFYQPTEGTILIDGVDINQIDPINLRRNISYVPQDIQLFYGTVKDNITLGTPSASDAEVLRAAQIAGVDRFTNRHPMGLDRPVGENGFGLSGGQRQSIACARAFVNNAPIVILDEPTSSMDNVSEMSLLQALQVHLVGKTMLLVTHKMSMMPLVTRLIVVEGGKMVADGPRDAVIQALSKGMPTPANQANRGN